MSGREAAKRVVTHGREQVGTIFWKGARAHIYIHVRIGVIRRRGYTCANNLARFTPRAVMICHRVMLLTMSLRYVCTTLPFKSSRVPFQSHAVCAWAVAAL